LVSTKVPELEKIDDLKRRIDEASNTHRWNRSRSALSAAFCPMSSATLSAKMTKNENWTRCRNQPAGLGLTGC
jgi:hypothetical protein